MNALRNHRMPALAVMAGWALLAVAAPMEDAVRGPQKFFTHPSTPARAPDPNGFLQRWLLLDPIRVEIRSNAQLTDSFVQAIITREYFAGQFTLTPRDGDKVKVGDAELAWHAVDATGYNVNLYHFADGLGKPKYNVVFWAVAIVNSPREMRDVRLAVGSNSASIWWVNGREVIDLYGDRHMIADDGISKRLTLNKGPNIVRAAVVNAPGLSNMCARFLDAQYKPLKDLSLRVSEGGK